MRLLDLTLATPAADLALEEALLEQAEAGRFPGGLLRLWEPTATAVILGRGSRAAHEARLDACRRDAVPIHRRTSGGAAIVAGSGCLMYSLFIDAPVGGSVARAHATVLGGVAAALARLGVDARREGLSDLAVARRKVSGNSLRLLRRAMLYHGTLLYDFPLERVARYLDVAPRQPEYRRGRSHDEFVANIDRPLEQLKAALVDQFQADQPLSEWPCAEVERLVADRYARDDWNLRL